LLLVVVLCVLYRIPGDETRKKQIYRRTVRCSRNSGIFVCCVGPSAGLAHAVSLGEGVNAPIQKCTTFYGDLLHRVTAQGVVRTCSRRAVLVGPYKGSPRRQPFSEILLAELHPGNYSRPAAPRTSRPRWLRFKPHVRAEHWGELLERHQIRCSR
jgi:hypothetical protein